MVSQEQVAELYRLVLDRDPESEAAVNEKRGAESLAALAIDMLRSAEFFNNNKNLLKTHVRSSRNEC